MLGEKQVYVVGNFESYKAKEMERLLPYIKPNDPNRVIILSTPSAKTPKKSSPFFKLVSGFAEPVEFKKLTVQETKSKIISRLAKNKLAIEADALDLLTGLLDGDRGGLESELHKLIDYKSEGGSITIVDIKKVCAGHEIFDIFELGDVIIARNAQKALRMVQALVGVGTNIDYLISQLQAHFISLYLVKNGKAPVGNRGFLIPKFRQQAKAYSNQQLEGIIIELAEANTEIRQQRFPEELVLETLTFKLSQKN
jgi:DNA polymerase-3 subunit delta